MPELIVNTFLTLDGVMQAPGGPEEDRSGGFDQGGWSFGYWDEQMQGAMGESMSKPFDLVLGRKTYEIFAAHWPHSDDPGAAPLNTATKHVASTTLNELEWENSKLIEGEVPEGVRALKEEDSPELQVHGSANLIQTLLEHGLIDEFRLWIFPLVLGNGKRLFDGGTVPAGLELTSSQVSSTGVIMATYRSGAEIKGGSFAAEPPSAAELARRAAQQR
jgi:dihydrofolate reductase